MALLTTEEIKLFIDEDAASTKKHFARMGERYFDGDHDIKNLRLFYYNADGELVEDKARANVKIAHPFFKELVEHFKEWVCYFHVCPCFIFHKFTISIVIKQS